MSEMSGIKSMMGVGMTIMDLTNKVEFFSDEGKERIKEDLETVSSKLSILKKELEA